MSINFRKPNGYYITRFRLDLRDYYEIKRNREEREKPVSDVPEEDQGEKVTLVYNGEKEVKVNRKSLGDSCFYFQCLLNGSFAESQKSRIEIYLEESFQISFEVFEIVVEYATYKKFPNPSVDLQISDFLRMIQLAILWQLDGLIDTVEMRLVDMINVDTIPTIHTLANQLNLNKLREECLKVEKALDSMTPLERKWPRCPLTGHEGHHYMHCLDNSEALGEDDWHEDPRDENWFN